MRTHLIGLLLLFNACGSPALVQQTNLAEPVPVPPVNFTIQGGNQSQLQINFDVKIVTTRNDSGGIDRVITKTARVKGVNDTTCVIRNQKGEPVAKVNIHQTFDSGLRQPFGLSLYLFDQYLDKDTPVLAKTKIIYRDPDLHLPSLTWGIGIGFLLGVALIYIIISRIRYEQKHVD